MARAPVNLDAVRNLGASVFQDARIIVTGGTGSLGRALVQRLAQTGAREIRVVARQTPTAPVEGSRSCDVFFTAADIAAPGAVAALVAGAHVIFHLAAIKAVSTCEEDPMEAVRTNV